MSSCLDAIATCIPFREYSVNEFTVQFSAQNFLWVKRPRESICDPDRCGTWHARRHVRRPWNNTVIVDNVIFHTPRPPRSSTV